MEEWIKVMKYIEGRTNIRFQKRYFFRSLVASHHCHIHKLGIPDFTFERRSHSHRNSYCTLTVVVANDGVMTHYTFKKTFLLKTIRLFVKKSLFKKEREREIQERDSRERDSRERERFKREIQEREIQERFKREREI